MIEITNKMRSPVQLVIRSRRGPTPRELTVLNIPGIGANKNKYYLEDELVTDYIWRAEKDNLISVRRVN